MYKQVIDTAKDKMGKTTDLLKKDLTTLRAGRANPQILDKILVDYYGTPTPLNQLGNISSPEPRMLVIAPWENKMISAIEKAIQKSDIGINPSNDGKVVRLVVPELNEERRKDLVKQVKKMVEEAKVALRAIRRDAMDKFKKEQKKGEITEDDLKDLEKDMQKLTDDGLREKLASLRAHADALPLGEFAAHMKTRETEYEQLLVYFLYRHVPEALDDGDVSSKAAFAVASVRLLFALGALHFLLHGDFTVEDQIALCRLYSAEVEYSDDNMEALFDALM